MLSGIELLTLFFGFTGALTTMFTHVYCCGFATESLLSGQSGPAMTHILILLFLGLILAIGLYCFRLAVRIEARHMSN